MKARIAVGTALVGLAAVAASVAAVPETASQPFDGPLTALTLPLGSRAVEPRSEVAAPSVAPTLAPPQVLVDPGVAPAGSPTTRSQPAAKVGVVVKPTPTPKPVPRIAASGGGGGGSVLRGLASWYCNNDGSRAQVSACHYAYPDTGSFNAYAAAGPKLRAALGGGERWRGRVVSVDGVRVKLVDWCQCYQGQSNEKVIDLYYDVFQRTGGQVTIRW